MPSQYDPYNWYWLADDARLYSSKAQMLVPDDDPDYVAWAAVNTPTPWPTDIDGNQSLAELQRVLFPYRITVDLKAYAFLVREQKETGGCSITGVSGLTEIRTDVYTQGLINRYNQAATADAAFTVPWVLPDRSTIMLDQLSIGVLFNETTSFIVGTYDTYRDVVTGIDDSTITTIAQIDTAFGTSLRRGTPVDIGWKS